MHKTTRIVRTEFAAAIAQIAAERKIEPSSIFNAIEQALVSAFRKQYGLEEGWYYYATIDQNNGESRLYKCPILEMDEETLEPLKWDESKSEEVTPAGFGRIAAQTAKQVILQKIRESERATIIDEYRHRLGEIVTAQVLRMDGRRVVLDLGRGQGVMPPKEQMRGEFYRVNSRITVLIKEIVETHRGDTIIVSRADKNLVVKLFEREVPEVGSGAVEVALIAREAGVRTKLAVRSTQEGVDPVGSCVGQRGVRVQAVINELNNEKLDIIPFSEDMKLLLQGALAPADGLLIEIDDDKKSAIVTAPNEQLSLAIGRGGQNVRLAAKLTGLKITIKSASGETRASATGDEEYEIDTFKGLAEETREQLIEHKLTTLMDLSRFKNKWQEFELPQDQLELLVAKVAEFEKQMSEEEGENALLDKVNRAKNGRKNKSSVQSNQEQSK